MLLAWVTMAFLTWGQAGWPGWGLHHVSGDRLLNGGCGGSRAGSGGGFAPSESMVWAWSPQGVDEAALSSHPLR